MSDCALTTEAAGRASEHEREQEHITKFFENKVLSILSATPLQVTPTQSNCHAFASNLLHCKDIKPVQTQGSFSYTVFSFECQKVVQFRLKPLDEATLLLAYETYGDLVPPATFVEGFALPVYIFPLAHGHLHTSEPHPETRSALERQIRTVRDLARFVAKGAFTPQSTDCYAPESWTLTAESTLHMIIENKSLTEIEPGFAQRAELLLPRLGLLTKLPPVLCHVDFFEINIMVEPVTGALTAVLDWDGAQIEAFGMIIYGVYDSFFGCMKDHSSDAEWSWFGTPLPDSDDMRSARDILESNFWNVFWDAVPSSFSKAEYEDAIAVAIEIGLVQRNLPRSLVEGPEERREQLFSNIRLMRGVWLSK
ncbi:hypothetical protein H2198_003029 [Neophaeococcomyces mojaviensis]|uniref:Uncharacterized protein n=1 Tax=Neophaeococcomyces mojaviensis TaxID=3383035 RepID=A0ACC3ACG6_9EURO|nr:hypothetical protein H2198_003029 [Knufia sp. JES_112]